MANVIDKIGAIVNGTYGDKYGYSNGSVLDDIAALSASTYKPASQTTAAKVLTPESSTASANDWGAINVPTGPSNHATTSHSSSSTATNLTDRGYSGSTSGSAGATVPASKTGTTPAATTTATTTPTTTNTKPASSGTYYAPSGSTSGSATASTPSPAPMQAVDPSKTVDYSVRDNAYSYYQQAMQNLQQMADAPTYNPQYNDMINGLVDQITNRQGFQYNLNDDQLYQQYRDKYLANGRLSMMDTMGQAAGLTGGYGSSYGQLVGQQAYDAQLQQLNDIVPELYDRAYQRYQDEGRRMDDLLGLYRDLDATDYSRYQDDLGQWNTNRDYLSNERDAAYSIYDNASKDVYTQEDRIKAEQAANLNQLLSLAAAGYNPTAQQIADAGITPDMWDYYKKMMTPVASGGGGYGGGTKTTSTTSAYLPGTTVNSDGTAQSLSKEQYDGVMKTIKYQDTASAQQTVLKTIDSMSTTQAKSAMTAAGFTSSQIKQVLG